MFQGEVILLLFSVEVYSLCFEFQVFFVVFSPTAFSSLLFTGFAFLAIVSPRTFPHFGLRSISTTFLLIGSGVSGFFTCGQFLPITVAEAVFGKAFGSSMFHFFINLSIASATDF